MTAMDIDDLVVVTGPLKLPEFTIEESFVLLYPGEVGRIVRISEENGVPQVYGFESESTFWIDPNSLTPLSEFQADETVQWGDPEDPDYVVLDGGAVDAEASSFVLAAWSEEDQAYWGDLIDIDLSLPLNIEDVFGPDDDLPIDVIHDCVHEESE